MYGQKYVRNFVKPLGIEKNKNGQKRSRGLDNARRLKRIYFIDPDDEDYKETLKMRGENWKRLVGCKKCSGLKNGRSSRRSPAWQLENVKSKKEVILEAQRDKNKVHLATVMDICHLKTAELELKFQKHKRRVVLRGDIVKDGSGAHGVFTEQGPACAPNDCRKSNGCYYKITRL